MGLNVIKLIGTYYDTLISQFQRTRCSSKRKKFDKIEIRMEIIDIANTFNINGKL
jgi:hypothetical protein